MISDVLAEPLGAAYPPLLEQAARSMQSVMLNAWPRMYVHRGEIVNGLCVCWVRICEEEELKGKVKELEDVKKELRACAELLIAVVEEDQRTGFTNEVGELIEADQRVDGLFKDLMD